MSSLPNYPHTASANRSVESTFVPIANVDMFSDALAEQTARVDAITGHVSTIADRLFGYWPEAALQKDTSGGDDIAARLRVLTEAVDALSLQLSRFG